MSLADGSSNGFPAMLSVCRIADLREVNAALSDSAARCHAAQSGAAHLCAGKDTIQAARRFAAAPPRTGCALPHSTIPVRARESDATPIGKLVRDSRPQTVSAPMIRWPTRLAGFGSVPPPTGFLPKDPAQQ